MTGYTDADLAEGWEFKIIRSATGWFRNPELLRRVLDEESRAGWTLVEKFDDQRVRLKRPAAARGRDGSLGFDPYRTTVGMSETRLGLTIAGSIIGAMLLIMLIVFLATR